MCHVVDDLQLRALRFGLSVMRKVVITVGQSHLGDFEDGRTDAFEHQGDGTGGIGLDREAREVIHDLHLIHVERGVGGIDGHGRLHDRLGLALPAFRCLEALFQVAHAGEVLIEAFAVAGAYAGLEVFGLSGDGVEDAAAGIEFANLRVDLGRASLQEHLLEHSRGFVFGRDGDAGAGPGEAAGASVDGEGERWETGEDSDLFGDVLIEGNRIAEGAAARVRGGGKEADVGGMSAIDIGVGDAGENAEVVAVFLEKLEVGRGRVVAARPVGKNWSARRPRLLQMASMRRGVLGADDWAKTGAMESRNGRASATPAPRRNRRRGMGPRVAMCGNRMDLLWAERRGQRKGCEQGIFAADNHAPPAAVQLGCGHRAWRETFFYPRLRDNNRESLIVIGSVGARWDGRTLQR